MANASTSQDSQRDRLTMNEILESLGMSMLSKKFEDEKVDFNVIMSASDEDLIRLGVRTIGDRVKLSDACRRVYTRLLLLLLLRIFFLLPTNLQSI